MSRAGTRLAIVVCVLALGIVLKVDRYAGTADGAKAATLARIDETMLAHGWRPAPSAGQVGATLYEHFEFRRDGCAHPVVVAVMSGNAEAAGFIQLRHEGNVAFINGRTVGRPGSLERQFAVLRSTIGRWVGGQGSGVPPLVAVAPAPHPSASGCLGPSLAAWTGASTEAALQEILTDKK